MIKYVRFLPKDAPADAEPKYGVLKAFHFSEGSSEQIMILEGTPYEYGVGSPHPNGETIPITDVRLFAPVNPSKIIGIGLNYKDHAKEQGKPLPEIPFVFIKAVSALTHPGSTIRLNRYCSEVHYEGELAVVIGRKCSRVAEDDALNFVAGYTIANDVTERTIQKAESSYARGKGMDTFCPLGPFLVSGIDWQNRKIRTSVNGELRQSGSTSDMVHGVPKLVSFVSQFMTLFPGDVILSGTPAGVGPIRSGDKIKVEIDELGALENAVEHEI